MIKLKRQGGGASCDVAAAAPTELKYGEPAIDSEGRLYIGDGAGKVASKVKSADNGLWLYTATFLASGWADSDGAYIQTPTVTALDDGPALDENTTLHAPQTSKTDVQATNEEKQEALGIIDQGKATIVDGNVQVLCWEKPACDIDVYWYAR